MGSFLGVRAFKKVTKAYIRPTQFGRKPNEERNSICRFNRKTDRSNCNDYYLNVIIVGCSDPVIPVWKGHRLSDKRYARDNRLIPPESSYRRRGLAPKYNRVLFHIECNSAICWNT